MRRLHRSSGFSMVELVIALAVTVVLLGMLVQANEASVRIADATQKLGVLDENAHLALTRLGKELRWAQPGTALITPENGSDRIDFRMAQGYDGTNTVWSSPVAFRYAPSLRDTNENGIQDEGVLERTQDGTTRVLCRNLSLGGLSIVRDGNNIVVVLSTFKLSDRGQLLESEVQASITLVHP